jgi:DNA-binding LacI/PurR family transcriptional regulator
MSALRELSIRIPDDISIIGNDDIYYANIYPVPLTTIHAPQHEIGRKAAEILIRNIESQEILKIEKVVMETELIIRESTRAMEKELV